MNNSSVVKAFENAWKDIQMVHPEVPGVIIVVGSGGRKAPNTYGHFARKTWTTEDQELHEVLIVAEHLNRGGRELFNTLLHESTHALAEARGIKDVSGQRHNRKFVALADEMGMDPPENANPTIGWSAVQMNESTEAIYAKAIAEIDTAVQFHRSLKLKEKETQKTTWIAICGCDRKIRIGKKEKDQAEELNIFCQLCGSEFELDE